MRLTESLVKSDDFVVVGYMILEGKTYTSQPRPELHGLVYSPTSCVCKLHPHDSVLLWISNAPEVNEQYRQQLNMSLDDFTDLQDATEAALDTLEWGLDSVFVFRSIAVRFFERFFADRARTRLTELSVRSQDLSEFLEATAPVVGLSGEQYATRAMHLAAVQQMPTATDGQLLGFETVGVNAYSDTHTSVCYAVRNGFEQAGITFNPEGYLSSLNHAVKAAQMNNNAEEGAVGDAYWFAVRVAELARSQVS